VLFSSFSPRLGRHRYSSTPSNTLSFLRSRGHHTFWLFTVTPRTTSPPKSLIHCSLLLRKHIAAENSICRTQMSSENTPNAESHCRITQEPTSEGVPTQEISRSWGPGVLHAWLFSLCSSFTFGNLAQTAAKFLKAQVNREVFPDATEKWFANQCNMPAGVAKRLCMIGEAITKNTSRTAKGIDHLIRKKSEKGKRLALLGRGIKLLEHR
jgi:hypothetical protein